MKSYKLKNLPYEIKNSSDVVTMAQLVLQHTKDSTSLSNIHIHFEIFNDQIYVYHSYPWVKKYLKPNYLGRLEKVIARLDKGFVDPCFMQEKNNFMSVSSRLTTSDDRKFCETIAKINADCGSFVPLNIPQDATLFSNINIELIRCNPGNDLEKKLQKLFLLLESGRSKAKVVLATQEKEKLLEEKKIEEGKKLNKPKLCGAYDKIFDNKTLEESLSMIKSLPKDHPLYKMQYP